MHTNLKCLLITLFSHTIMTGTSSQGYDDMPVAPLTPAPQSTTPTFRLPSLNPAIQPVVAIQSAPSKPVSSTQKPLRTDATQQRPNLPQISYQHDLLVNKCFRTVCKDWVQECHWFCDWIQTTAQRRRCMECLSWKGRHCFGCFQL